MNLEPGRSQGCIYTWRSWSWEKVWILNLEDLKVVFIPGEAGVGRRFESWTWKISGLYYHYTLPQLPQRSPDRAYLDKKTLWFLKGIIHVLDITAERFPWVRDVHGPFSLFFAFTFFQGIIARKANIFLQWCQILPWQKIHTKKTKSARVSKIDFGFFFQFFRNKKIKKFNISLLQNTFLKFWKFS